MPIIEGVTFTFSKFDNFEIANIVEKMPIKSFQELIEQISYAETQTELIFDSSCKNIIINKDTNKMTAIDFYKKNIETYILIRF